MKIVIHEAAKAELRKSRRWYDRRQPGLGIELLDDVRGALARIDSNPTIGLRYLNTHVRFHVDNAFSICDLLPGACQSHLCHGHRSQAAPARLLATA
jgi:hypothetical protein